MLKPLLTYCSLPVERRYAMILLTLFYALLTFAAIDVLIY